MEAINQQQAHLRRCVFCDTPLEGATYDFFGVTMHGCLKPQQDRHILARDLDEDVVSGISKIWALVPYDPITMELKDWCIFGSIVHDHLYEVQTTTRKEADNEWLAINNAAIATIQNRQLREAWERNKAIMWQFIKKTGWLWWWRRKLGFAA